MAKGPLCTVCSDSATQRIVRPVLITFRCEKHEVGKAEAKTLNAKLFKIKEDARA